MLVFCALVHGKACALRACARIYIHIYIYICIQSIMYIVYIYMHIYRSISAHTHAQALARMDTCMFTNSKTTLTTPKPLLPEANGYIQVI